MSDENTFKKALEEVVFCVDNHQHLVLPPDHGRVLVNSLKDKDRRIAELEVSLLLNQDGEAFALTDNKELELGKYKLQVIACNPEGRNLHTFTAKEADALLEALKENRPEAKHEQ